MPAIPCPVPVTWPYRRRVRNPPAGPSGSTWSLTEDGRYLRYVAHVAPPTAADGFLSTPVYLSVSVPVLNAAAHPARATVDVALTFHWDAAEATHAAVHLAGMSDLPADHTLASGWQAAIVEALNAAHPETTEDDVTP